LGVSVFLERLEAALAGGLRLVMMREPAMPKPQLQVLAREVVRRCRRAGARVVFNGPPEAMAASGADGLHLPARQLMQMTARPAAALCGASCHDASELSHAQALGLDYAVVGPVQATPSHACQAGIGWDCFAGLVAGCSIPVYAIGGMQAADLERAWSAGAHGVAMIRGAWRRPA
jgi:8-oxo-dGTP diphosphatase